MSHPTDSSDPTDHVLAEGRFIRFVRDTSGWERVERIGCTGIVAIVAVTRDGKLILTEQYRRPVKVRVIELPAGLAGDGGRHSEDLETAARRELIEETGYTARNLTVLTKGPPSGGLSTEIVTIFLARDAEQTGPGGGDDTEAITVHAVPLSDIRPWLEQRMHEGLLVDPKVYTGLYFLAPF